MSACPCSDTSVELVDVGLSSATMACSENYWRATAGVRGGQIGNAAVRVQGQQRDKVQGSSATRFRIRVIWVAPKLSSLMSATA
jgi:hypothetical protein